MTEQRFSHAEREALRRWLIREYGWGTDASEQDAILTLLAALRERCAASVDTPPGCDCESCEQLRNEAKDIREIPLLPYVADEEPSR